MRCIHCGETEPCPDIHFEWSDSSLQIIVDCPYCHMLYLRKIELGDMAFNPVKLTRDKRDHRTWINAPFEACREHDAKKGEREFADGLVEYRRAWGRKKRKARKEYEARKKINDKK